MHTAPGDYSALSRARHSSQYPYSYNYNANQNGTKYLVTLNECTHITTMNIVAMFMNLTFRSSQETSDLCFRKTYNVQ